MIRCKYERYVRDILYTTFVKNIIITLSFEALGTRRLFSGSIEQLGIDLGQCRRGVAKESSEFRYCIE